MYRLIYAFVCLYLIVGALQETPWASTLLYLSIHPSMYEIEAGLPNFMKDVREHHHHSRLGLSV